MMRSCKHYKTNRKKRKAFCPRLFFAPLLVCAAFAAALIAVSLGGRSVYIDVRKNLYFVCGRTVYLEEAAVSASAIVCSGGGAGYILEREKGYSVVYSLYMTNRDAASVCENLQSAGQKAEVVALSVEKVYLPASFAAAAKNVASFYGLYYDCIALLSRAADELDAGRIDLSGARCALENGAGVLEALGRSLEEGTKKERAKCSFLKEEAESAANAMRGCAQGLFNASDIRAIYVSMGDFYIKSAQKLQK